MKITANDAHIGPTSICAYASSVLCFDGRIQEPGKSILSSTIGLLIMLEGGVCLVCWAVDTALGFVVGALWLWQLGKAGRRPTVMSIMVLREFGLISCIGFSFV